MKWQNFDKKKKFYNSNILIKKKYSDREKKIREQMQSIVLHIVLCRWICSMSVHEKPVDWILGRDLKAKFQSTGCGQSKHFIVYRKFKRRPCKLDERRVYLPTISVFLYPYIFIFYSYFFLYLFSPYQPFSRWVELLVKSISNTYV